MRAGQGCALLAGMTNESPLEAEQEPMVFVVAYDFSDCANLALAEALVLADMHPRATVHVVAALDSAHALDGVEVERFDLDAASAVQLELQLCITEAVQRLKPSDFYFYAHVRIGNPAATVVALAGEVEADLIIAGTHGRTGIRRVVIGSVAESMVRHAHCPVLVMRPKAYAVEDRPSVEPEPPDPPGEEEHFHAHIDPARFAFTKRHQVMPLRPDDWPLW